jgi:HAD superfamily hydrolase (TIGR01549 family)
MKNISAIKIISTDLFRTLVKVDENREFIWRTFMGENYEDTIAQQYWERATEILFNIFDSAAVQTDPFKNIRDIFIESFTLLFEELGFQYDPQTAAETLFQGHKLDNLFDDTRPFLKAAGTRYPVCLSTDCDTDMLDGIENIYSFDTIFFSEQMRTYKAHPRFFNEVLQHYRLKPENILHIGDSKSDILTPKQLGLQTCWLNRSGEEWKHAIKPDFEVRSLLDILEILGI